VQHIGSLHTSKTADSVPQPASILDRLRQETRAEHEALENDLELAGPGLNESYYRRVLQAFYGFYRPFEDSLRATGSPSLIRFTSTRFKVPALEADLAFWGIRSSDLALCTDLPQLAPDGRLWGALYVIEGSTLGGQLITRELENVLGLQGGAGYQFFRGYGGETGSRWKEFRSMLMDASAELPGDEMVAGAAETFRSIHKWLRTAGVCRTKAKEAF
jgi:heme oxygenase (biliverdin-IX-beta and delta-forming)